jgi:hypothetical protein
MRKAITKKRNHWFWSVLWLSIFLLVLGVLAAWKAAAGSPLVSYRYSLVAIWAAVFGSLPYILLRLLAMHQVPFFDEERQMVDNGIAFLRTFPQNSPVIDTIKQRAEIDVARRQRRTSASIFLIPLLVPIIVAGGKSMDAFWGGLLLLAVVALLAAYLHLDDQADIASTVLIAITEYRAEQQP